MSSLGQRIRAARERQGLTQGELAERIGVARKTVVNWEADTYSPQNSMARLVEALGDLGSDAGVSPVEQSGVLLDLPATALEGLSEVEREEVIARAKATALQAAREIKRSE